MNDMSPPAPRPAKPRLPDCTPVPRKCQRHDGWTPERQRAFIEALADCGSVKSAANSVGMTDAGAYQLRRHPEAGGFRKAWEGALKLGVERLEDVAMERALHGVEVPVYHFGAVVGTRRVYNDKLLMFLLRNRAPRRFAADSLHNANASTRSHLKRLKREWRAEWEAEREQQGAAKRSEVLEGIDAKLDQMRTRRIAAMSPKVRAAWDALQQAQAEEEAEKEARCKALPGPGERKD